MIGQIAERFHAVDILIHMHATCQCYHDNMECLSAFGSTIEFSFPYLTERTLTILYIFAILFSCQ